MTISSAICITDDEIKDQTEGAPLSDDVGAGVSGGNLWGGGRISLSLCGVEMLIVLDDCTSVGFCDLYLDFMS